MPLLNDILGKYGGEVKKLFGNIDDVRVSRNLSKALGDIAKYEAQLNEESKFENLNDRLLGVDMLKIPTSRDIDVPQFNFEHPEFKTTDAYKQFLADQMRIHPGKTEEELKYTGDEISKYLDVNYPEMKTALQGDPRFYGNVKKKVDLSPEDLQQEYYKQAGFLPEDLKFYEDYKNRRISPKKFNKALERFVTSQAPNLISRGEYGSSKYQELGEVSKGLMFDKDELQGPQYDTIKDDYGSTYLIEKGRPDRLLKQIFKGKDSTRFIPGAKPYAYEKDGKKFFGTLMLDEQNQPTTVETEIQPGQEMLWQQVFAESFDKGLTLPQELEYKNIANINYKMDLSALGLLGGKGSKGGQEGLSLTEEEFQKKLLDFRELSGNYNKLNASQQKQYKALQHELVPYFGNNWKMLNSAIEKVSQLTDKQRKAFINNLHVGNLTEIAPENFTSQDQKMQEMINAQKNQITTLFNQAKEKLTAGELNQEQYKQLIMRIFTSAQGQMDPNLLNQIKEALKQYGITGSDFLRNLRQK